MRYVLKGPVLATLALNGSLQLEKPDSLRQPWLSRYGAATNIDAEGTVAFVVLSTGEADRAALAAQLAGAETRVTELVNKARAEAALPPVRRDPALAAASRRWVEEASRRGCFVGFDDSPDCPGSRDPHRAWAKHLTWSDPADAFTFYLAPAEPGDDRMKRFGAAAILGDDGTIWSMVSFAP